MAWFICNVLKAGPAEDGHSYIQLQDHGGAFNHGFRAVTAMRREMLATALAALSSGFPVDANLAGTAQ